MPKSTTSGKAEEKASRAAGREKTSRAEDEASYPARGKAFASAEDKNIDEAASSACTKSGAIALGISVILLCLIPYWQHRPIDKALVNYLDSRVLLNMDLDQLEQDPLWGYYKQSHPKAELTPLSKLPKVYPDPPPQWEAQPDTAPSPTSDGNRADERGQRPKLALKVGLVGPERPFARKIAFQVPPTVGPNVLPPPTGLRGPKGLREVVHIAELDALEAVS